ncbi:TPA: hypothetical protein HA318_06065 [Candidatus Micrarchaeota archaeon]|nr:hypothetical protein [Candidatus Micrarchaeota archaeon]
MHVKCGSLMEAKGLVKNIPKPSETVPHRQIPMFLPALVSEKAQGNGAMEVTNRQEFLNQNIPEWIRYTTFKPIAIMFAAGAIIAFSVNIYISAFLGLCAGYFYGHYQWKKGYVERLLKSRWLYEGT